MDSGPLSARTSLGWWFKPQVDLFATRFNHRLPLYVSPVLDPTAWAIDALSIPWSNLLGYAFPPFPILGKVLRKAREDLATLILVAPRWPAQAWFPELLHLSHVPPVKLSLKEVIKAAYARPNEELAVFSPKPHDIRAWASSLAFSHSVSLQKVLDAAYWRSPGTFIQYYLQDVSRLRDDGSRGIASAVVAQHPITATRPVSSRSSSR
ncbi:hypothetical protein ACOMHN_032040 [Nucella lapillus]